MGIVPPKPSPYRKNPTHSTGTLLMLDESTMINTPVADVQKAAPASRRGSIRWRP